MMNNNKRYKNQLYSKVQKSLRLREVDCKTISNYSNC